MTALNFLKKPIIFTLHIILAMFFIGCAELTKLKVDSDGYFRLTKLPTEKIVRVWAPEECLVDMFVFESSDNTVDFVTGRWYWQAGGLYSIQVGKGISVTGNSEEFFDDATKTLPTYMENDRHQSFKFKYLTGKVVNISGAPAYQGFAIEEGRAIMVTTKILVDEFSVYASLIYPSAASETEDVSSLIPWECYNKFISSVATETRS